MLARTGTSHHARAARRSAACLLLGLATLAGLTLLLAAPASAATQDCFDVDFQEQCELSNEFTFTDTVLCDFPVEVSVTTSLRYRPVFAKDGSGDLTSEVAHVRDHATIVNTATGRSFTDRDSFTDRTTYLSDGSVLLRTTGILHNARVDTGERLFHQSGNRSILIGADGEVLDEIVHGNFDYEPAFPGQVCPILAQPA
jgi:hypothetical protein